MILVTLGTQKQDFSRLLQYIEDSKIKDEIIVQAGHTKFKSKKMKIFDFIPYEEMEEYIEKADCVITHSGTGSVLTPLKKDKKVIVCARLSKYGEHVDDHQKQLVEVFKEEGYVLELTEENKLDDLMKEIKKFKPKKYVSNTDNFKKRLNKEIKKKDDNKRNNKKLILLLIGIFFLFWFLSALIPYTGDDWQNYGNGKFGFINVLRNAKAYYLGWEGRLGSRIIIFFVTFKKWIWNILNGLSMTAILFFGSKIIKPKNKIFAIASLLLAIFLTNYTTFVQCFFWIAGHVTYTISTALYIIYIYYLFNLINKNRKLKKLETIFMFLFNIGVCTFVENLAVGVIVTNLLALIYSYFKNNKKIEKNILILSVGSIFGLLIQILSPGTQSRIVIETSKEFAELNIFQKIIYNIPNFIKYGFILNPTLIFLMSLSNILLTKKKEKKLIVKYLLIIFFCILPAITILGNLYLLLPFNIDVLITLNEKLKIFYNESNWLIIIYWLIYILLTMYTIIKYLKKEEIVEILILYVSAFACLGSMLITPTWSNRVAFPTIVLLYITVLKILTSIFENDQEKLKVVKISKIFVYSACILYSTLLIVIYYNVNNCVKFRNDYIISESQKGNTKINYYLVPEKLLWSQYPYSNAYRNAFNEILGVDSSVEYNTKLENWDYQIIFKGNQNK